MIYAETAVGFGNVGGGLGSVSTVGGLGCSVVLLPFRIDTVALPSFTSFSAPPVFFRPAAIPFLFFSLESVDTSLVDPDPIFHLPIVLCYWLPHVDSSNIGGSISTLSISGPMQSKHGNAQKCLHTIFLTCVILNDAGNGQAGTDGPLIEVYLKLQIDHSLEVNINPSSLNLGVVGNQQKHCFLIDCFSFQLFVVLNHSDLFANVSSI